MTAIEQFELNDFPASLPLSSELEKFYKASRKNSTSNGRRRNISLTVVRSRRISEMYEDEGIDFCATCIPIFDYIGKVPFGGKICPHGKEMEQYQMCTNAISTLEVSELMDGGWRRDGYNFFKNADNDCCHTYALRLDAKGFKLGSNHRKILNKMQDFVKYGNDPNVVKAPKGKKNNKPESTTLDAYMERIHANCDAHKLKIRMIKNNSLEFDETYEDSCALFLKYRQAIHGNTFTKENFENSIVTTPLTSENETVRGKLGKYLGEKHLGTFHRQYFLDKELIGVALLDVLPGYIMAQFQYYNPDRSDLNLGNFMILDQILFAKQLSEKIGRNFYYSTSLFMNSLKKHHYKLQYASEILCIENQQWVPLEKKLLPMLENEEKIIPEKPRTIIYPKIFSIPCLYNGKILPYAKLEELLSDEMAENTAQKLAEYVHATGEVSKKLLFKV